MNLEIKEKQPVNSQDLQDAQLLLSVESGNKVPRKESVGDGKVMEDNSEEIEYCVVPTDSAVTSENVDREKNQESSFNVSMTQEAHLDNEATPSLMDSVHTESIQMDVDEILKEKLSRFEGVVAVEPEEQTTQLLAEENNGVMEEELNQKFVSDAPVEESSQHDIPSQASIPNLYVATAGSSLHAQSSFVIPEEAQKKKYSGLLKEQMRYCGAMVRSLKRTKDAFPFLEPVDPVKLGIPTYFQVVTQPMDLVTIERNLNEKLYEKPDQFIEDMRLIFNNCYIFNGSDSPVSRMAKNLEKLFNSQLKKMPQKQERRLSTASSDDFRPKRDVHPPTPVLVDSQQSRPKKGMSPQIKFCVSVYNELMKKNYQSFGYIFYEPVDPVALQIPTYFSIVKHPMDLSTIKKKLDNCVYSDCDAFEADVRLMLNNCFTFNPDGTVVNEMGRKLEAIFNKKWNSMPDFTETPKSVKSKSNRIEYSSGSEVDMSDEDRQIATLERNIMEMHTKLMQLKAEKERKKKKKKEAQKKPKKAPAPPKPKTPKPAKRPREDSSDEEVQEITFDQKTELSENINTLSPEHLQTVVEIIQAGMPHLRDAGQEEIELDIDSLDTKTLSKLYKFVSKNSKKKQPAKKRKLSEHEHAKRIEELEAQIQKFDTPPAALNVPSSDSSSSDEESDNNA